MNSLAIGDWQVLPALNELRRAGAARRVQPQQMELLMRLAAEPDEVISRETLIEEVWSRDAVNDEVLSRAIAELRQALGDNARKPAYIETIPKRGYRLIATVGAAQAPDNQTLSTSMRWALVMLIAAMAAAAVLLVRVPQPEPATVVDVSSNAVVLTGQPGVERAPAVSPDSGKVAYIVEPAIGEGGHVAWVDVASAAITEVDLPQLQPAQVRWGPDGARLAVSGVDDDRCLIAVQNKTGVFENVIGCGAGDLEWSADGQWILFAPPSSSGHQGLARFHLEDGRLEEVTVTTGATQFDSLPRLSNDGTRLAFTRGDLTIREVWVQDLEDTHGPRQLSHDGQLVTGLAWRDENHLIYSSDRDAIQAIREIDIHTRQIRALGARDARGLDYAAGRLVWERPKYQANIWRISLVGEKEARPWIVSNRYDNHPAVAPDDQTIVFISNRSDRVALWTTDFKGEHARKLLELSDTRVTRPTWHPQGGRVLFAAFDNDGSRLMETDLDGNTQVLENTDGALEGLWLSDGITLVFIRTHDGSTGLWRLESGGKPERIGTFSPSRVMRDADDRLWFTYLGAPGLFRLSKGELHPEAVLPTLPQSSWNDWAVQGDILAYADEDGVWVGDLSGHSPKLVHDRQPTPVGLTLGLSHSGEALFVAHTDGVEIDLVTTELE